MAGKVIGKTMNYGWAGKVARDADCIIDSRIVSDAVGSTAIAFGAPVFLNDDNTVRNMLSTDTTKAKLMGVAIAGVRQSVNYATQEAKYEVATQCDILTRGTVMIALPATYTTAAVAGGTVYVDPTIGFTTDASHTASSTTVNHVDTGYKFTTGKVDANHMAEVTILTKNVL